MYTLKTCKKVGKQLVCEIDCGDRVVTASVDENTVGGGLIANDGPASELVRRVLAAISAKEMYPNDPILNHVRKDTSFEPEPAPVVTLPKRPSKAPNGAA